MLNVDLRRYGKGLPPAIAWEAVMDSRCCCKSPPTLDRSCSTTGGEKLARTRVEKLPRRALTSKDLASLTFPPKTGGKVSLRQLGIREEVHVTRHFLSSQVGQKLLPPLDS